MGSVISLQEWREKQEKLSKLKSPSEQNIPWDELGLLPTEVSQQLESFMSTYITLDRAWRKPFKVKSTFAREGAFYVALCASENFITTNIAEDTWGDRWIITEVGMEAKRELDYVIKQVIAASTNPPGGRPN